MDSGGGGFPLMGRWYRAWGRGALPPAKTARTLGDPRRLVLPPREGWRQGHQFKSFIYLELLSQADTLFRD